jgi:hypothetical protein
MKTSISKDLRIFLPIYMPRLARISNLKDLLIGGITLIINSPKVHLNDIEDKITGL